MENRKVLIIGCGIAGPALAIQLAEIGFVPELFEARDEDKMNEGMFLGISPNGLNVLKRLIEIDLLKEEYTSGAMGFYNSVNKKIAELKTEYQIEKYGAETIQIKRAAIGELLREQTRRHGIEIHFGYKLSSLKETTEGVNAFFENGKVATGDMLIGCDGVHSLVRKQTFPDAPLPIYTKMLSTGAITAVNGVGFRRDEIKMIFGERAFFAYALSNKGEVWWFNNFYRRREPTKEEMQNALQNEIKTHLLEVHQKDPHEISSIIEKTGDIFAYPIYDMPSLKKWHTHRICLIGDAAHAIAPHVGQGASLALEDTVVICTCLREQQRSEKSFEQFQRLRKDRVEKIINQARKVGSSKSKPNPVATWFRDKLLHVFIKGEMKKLDWVYGYNSYKSDAIARDGKTINNN